MTNFYRLIAKNALPILFLLFLGTVLFRFMPEPERKNFQNLDATLHTLLTMEAMSEAPAGASKFLPSVTLGGERNKFIAWGGAIFDKAGNRIYTSFPPLGFVAPYLALEALGAPRSINSLFLFNTIIQLISMFLAFHLARAICNRLEMKTPESDMAAFAATLPYVFSMEALYSHGYVYWGQSLFQVFFLLFLVVVVRQVFSGKPFSGAQGAMTAACVALMCATEWTGFMVAAGTPLALFFVRSAPAKLRQTLALVIIGSAAATGLVIVAWFANAIGLDVFLAALQNRFVARNVTSSIPFSALLTGYASSFGLFLLLIPAGIAAMFWARRDSRTDVAVFVLIVALAAWSENVLMKQHAIEYHFDRLKVLLFFTAVVPLIWLIPYRAIKGAALIIGIAASFIALSAYRTARFFEDIHVNDNAAFLRNVNTDDGILATQGQVRGFLPLLFHRNVVEAVGFAQAEALALDKRQPVYWLDGDQRTNFILELKEIYRFGLNGEIRHFSKTACDAPPESDKPITVKECLRSGELYVRTVAVIDSHFDSMDLTSDALQPYDLTNDTWSGGVMRGPSATFFVADSRTAREVYFTHKKDITIVFSDGVERRIRESHRAGQFINVFLDGPPLDAANVGRPKRMQIRKIENPADLTKLGASDRYIMAPSRLP